MNDVATTQTKNMTASVKLDSLIEEAANALKLKAQSIAITSDADYIVASDFGSTIKTRFDQTEAERVKLKAPFLNGCNAIDMHYRAPLKTLTDALAAVKTRMLAWDAEKKRLAVLEAARQAEIVRQAQAEAKRKEEEALAVIREQERVQREANEAEIKRANAATAEAEAKARTAEAAKLAAEAQASGDRARADAAEQAQRDAQANEEKAKADAAFERQKAIDAKRAQLKAERETQTAVQALDTANEAASRAAQVTTEPVMTHVAGNRRKVVWSFEVVEGKEIPRKYLKLDDAAVAEVVQRYKEGAQEFLGDWIKISSRETLAIGGKK